MGSPTEVTRRSDLDFDGPFQRTRRALVGVAAALVLVIGLPLAALWAVSPGTTSPIRDGEKQSVPGSVAETLLLELGGLEQFVLIRGRDQTNPVLLLLHGGPGNPQAALFRAYNRELEDHFVVVNWDQRGAGRSYSNRVPAVSMTVEQLLADTRELTRYLMQRFGKRRILLLGHSWGSYLGIRAAQRHPEDYHAYVGVGQVADQQRSEERSYRAVLERARADGRGEAIRDLEQIGPPARGRYEEGLKGLGRQRRWVREFGGAAYGLCNREALWLFAKPILLFREYRVRDKLLYLRGEAFSMAHLEEPMLDDDLTQSVPELRVPKELVIFERSAHLVRYEEVAKFHEVLVHRVRPLALQGDS
ncbi:MAG: alpha/beta hydrolase [Myxococcota bacterium]